MIFSKILKAMIGSWSTNVAGALDQMIESTQIVYNKVAE